MKFLKYFLIFNGIYFVAQITISVIGGLVGIDLGPGASVGAIMAGSIVSGRAFVLDHQRLPNTAEKWRLVLGSLAVSLVISCSLLLLFLAATPTMGDLIRKMIADLGVAGIAALLGIVLAAYVATMYFGFGFVLSKVMKDYGPEPKGPEVRKEPRL